MEANYICYRCGKKIKWIDAWIYDTDWYCEKCHDFKTKETK